LHFALEYLPEDEANHPTEEDCQIILWCSESNLRYPKFSQFLCWCLIIHE